MTPEQMLKRLPKPFEWTPAERTRPIPINSNEEIFQAQSQALLAGKCPLCHAKITHEVDKDQIVWFRCTKSPAFHEWRRTLSFLTSD